MHINKERIQ